MNTDRTPLTDKELWRNLATEAPAASAAVTEMDFAAWLEGGLSETAAARIEAAVATDPEMRRAAIELADILGKPLPAAPTRMAVRAQALVGFEAERARSGGWLSLLGLSAGFGMPRAAMATAILLVAVSGFALGGGLGASYSRQNYVVASNTYTQASSSNELTAFFGTDGI